MSIPASSSVSGIVHHHAASNVGEGSNPNPLTMNNAPVPQKRETLPARNVKDEFTKFMMHLGDFFFVWLPSLPKWAGKELLRCLDKSPNLKRCVMGLACVVGGILLVAASIALLGVTGGLSAPGALLGVVTGIVVMGIGIYEMVMGVVDACDGKAAPLDNNDQHDVNRLPANQVPVNGGANQNQALDMYV